MGGELGLGFKHSTKPTQAHNIYRLPVKVVVNMPKKPTKSVYASTEVFMETGNGCRATSPARDRDLFPVAA